MQLAYDPNGNLLSQSGKISDIAYDHRNLPVNFQMNSGTDITAAYNAGGQRILKETSAGAWQFYVTDGQQTMAVIKNDGQGQTSMHFNLVGNSTFGRWEPGGARRYYITDHLGSTRAVVDNSGTVLETFDYYPFGLLMPQRSSTTGNTIEKFTGKVRDESIGLDYFGARYYDPALARWHSVDPLSEKHPEWSPYNYVLNNPMYYIDPDGRQIAANSIQNAQIKEKTGVSLPRPNPIMTPEQAGRFMVEMAADTPGDVFELATGLTVTGREGCRICAAGALLIPFASAALFRFGDEALEFTSEGISKFIDNNSGRINKKLGQKIGKGDLPFEPGKEGFNKALGTLKETLANKSKTSKQFLTRDKQKAVDIFSEKTGFTVRINAETNEFITLIDEATRHVK